MLKKLMGTATNFVISVGILVLAIFVVLSWFNTSTAKEKIAELNANVRLHTEIINELNITNSKLVEENQELKTEITGLKEETKKNAAAITEGTRRSEELALTRPLAPRECDEIVEYMSKEIEQWKANFSLAIKDRDDWKGIASRFELAYNNQITITLNLQKTIDLITEDTKLKDEIIQELRKDLKLKKLGINVIGGGMIVAVIAVVIFGMLK